MFIPVCQSVSLSLSAYFLHLPCTAVFWFKPSLIFLCFFQGEQNREELQGEGGGRDNIKKHFSKPLENYPPAIYFVI